VTVKRRLTVWVAVARRAGRTVAKAKPCFEASMVMSSTVFSTASAL
jgi:hypothetical protein